MAFNMKVKNLDSSIKKIINSLATLSEEQINKRCEQLTKELAENTPVDTGLAKASWKKHKVNNKNVVIENTCDYIEYLNAGSSKQAPEFFIEKTALKFGKPVGTIVNVR